MRILLLSAYDTLSHQKWRLQLVDGLTQFDWTVLTLAPRYFNYRIRTNALTWTFSEQEALEKTYDLIIATSLTDITTLRALNPTITKAPIWLYCHENQFAYPKSDRQSDTFLMEAKTTFLMNCITANKISFNSNWNRSSALAGLNKLVKAWPEKIPTAVISSIEDKSSVLPVPVQRIKRKQHIKNISNNMGANLGMNCITIIWNHRWEYDKGPEYLLAFVSNIDTLLVKHPTTGIALHIVGQQFRQQPSEFNELKNIITALEKNYDNFTRGHWGHCSSDYDYQNLLESSDIVLSTSMHDFQGLAIQEAVMAGCIPLLPNHLVYPEIFADEHLYPWSVDPQVCSSNIIKKLSSWLTNSTPHLPNIDSWSSDILLPKYKHAIEAIANAS